MLSVPGTATAATPVKRQTNKFTWSWVGKLVNIVMVCLVFASPAILIAATMPTHYYLHLFFGDRLAVSTAKYYVIFYGSIASVCSYLVYEVFHVVLTSAVHLMSVVERVSDYVFSEFSIQRAKRVEELAETVSGAIAITMLAVVTGHLFAIDTADLQLMSSVSVEHAKTHQIHWLSVMLEATKICRFASMASITNLITRIVCQQIHTYFHREFYEERLENSAFAMRCVRELRADRLPQMRMTGGEAVRSSTPASSILSVFTGVSSHGAGSGPVVSDGLSSMDDIDVDNHLDVVKFAGALFRALVGNDIDEAEAFETDSVDNESDAESVSFATINSVSTDTATKRLSVGHLIPILGVEKGHRFFAVIDTKLKSDLSEDEFVEALEEVLLEDARLTRSVNSNNAIIKKLTRLLLFVSFAMLVMLAAPVFSVQIIPSVATLGTVVLTFEFVFSSQISDAFNGLFFVIVSHPFDVGDEVVIDDESAYIVEEVGLWSCQFREADDNRLTYFANSALAKCRIANLRRSGDMCEHVYLELDTKTATNNKILAFEEQMTRQLARFDRDFHVPAGSLALYNLKFLNGQVLTAEFKVTHRANFQDRPLKARRSRLLTTCLRTALSRAKVELAELDYNGKWAYA